MLFLVTALFVLTASAGVVVRKTGTAPTGYEVDFTFVNTTATSVWVGGGLYPFSDAWHTSWLYGAGYDPHDYRPGDFPFVYSDQTNWPYKMKTNDAGEWTYTTPLPSGTYNYAFLVDCEFAALCSFASGKWIIDPDNPPFVNVPGDQSASTFQVPYDPAFQSTPEIDLNFDYALPAPEGQRGTIQTANYTSPGSVHPAPDVHEFAIYLPNGYGSTYGRNYPVLYLSHGGGGNGEDWENLARMSQIMDNLIHQGYIEPTVVVMPSFYNIEAKYNFTYGLSWGVAPDAPVVRENFQAYLFPWIEEHYAVSREPARRAFAGLSLGGRLTWEMYINATDYFGYFGIFSGAQGLVNLTQTVVANPALRNVGVFNGYGLYDITFDMDRSIETAMNAVGIKFVSRVVPFGAHFWNTWQDLLWNFGKRALWQPLPFTVETGRK